MLVRETTWTRTPSSSSSWYCWFLVAVDSFTSAAPKTLTSPAERGPNAAATLGPRMQRYIQVRVRKQRSGPSDSAWPFCWPVSRHPSNGLLPVLMSAIVHHSWAVRAGSGSPKPRRSSICPNVRTTVFTYLRSRVLVEQPILSRLLAHVPRRSLHRWPGFVLWPGFAGRRQSAPLHPVEHESLFSREPPVGTIRRSYSRPASARVSNCTSEGLRAETG